MTRELTGLVTVRKIVLLRSAQENDFKTQGNMLRSFLRLGTNGLWDKDQKVRINTRTPKKVVVFIISSSEESEYISILVLLVCKRLWEQFIQCGLEWHTEMPCEETELRRLTSSWGEKRKVSSFRLSTCRLKVHTKISVHHLAVSTLLDI